MILAVREMSEALEKNIASRKKSPFKEKLRMDREIDTCRERKKE